MIPPLEKQLTPRQMEIFALVARGLSNREISELLGISANTVKNHMVAILSSLGVTNRTEAAFAFKELVEAPQTDADDAVRTAVLAEQLGRPSLALVPFTNLTGNPDHDLTLRGIAEDLSIYLSRWRWFPIVSQTSMQSFTDTARSRNELHERLNVRFAVTGSLRVDNTQLRIAVHVHDLEHHTEIWADGFHGSLDATLEQQELLARRIVLALSNGIIDGMARQGASLVSPSNAWEQTVRGLWCLQSRQREQWQEASQLFASALAIDAKSSMAWYGTAYARQMGVYEQWTKDRDAAIAALGTDVAQALAMDPYGAHAHHAAGLHAIATGNGPAAIDHLQRALNYNPSLAPAASLLGQCFGMIGQTDACIEHMEEALQLDPHSPRTWTYRSVIGTAHYSAGRAPEATIWLTQALRAFPAHAGSLLSLAAAYVEMGELQQARSTIATLKEQRPDFSFAEHMKEYVGMSRPDMVERQLEALAKIGYRP